MQTYDDQLNRGDQGSGVDVLRALVRFGRLAQRRQTLIGVVLLAHLAAGAAYYTLAPRSFRSTAKLMIVHQRPDQVAAVGEQSSSESVMANQRELVSSPVVVQSAIAQLSPEHRVDLVNVPPEEWIGEVTSRLRTSAVRKTSMLTLSYQSSEPNAAAAVVSALIESYLKFVDKTHGETATETLENLTVERDQLNALLATKQQEMQQLRHSIGHLALEEEDGVIDPTISRAIQLNESFIEAQQQRIETQASLATVEAAISRNEDVREYLGLVEEAVGRQVLLTTLGMSEQDQEALAKQEERLVQINSDLRRFAPHLGARHPRVVALQNEAAGLQQYLAEYRSGRGRWANAASSEQVATMLRRLLHQAIAQASQREQQLAASFESARMEATLHSSALVDLSMRQREIARLEQQHDILFEKIAAVDMRQLQAPIRVTPVEEPLPNLEPTSPQFRLVLVASIVMGLGVGLGIVYLQDLLDDRFGSPEEIALQLDLPVLAMIRKLGDFVGEGLGAVAMHADGESAETEAFRTLRTALTLSTESAERIAISSAEPSDGKTTVSSNLAVAFAQVGKRTLVIDADLRRPGMTALMGLKRQPGVTDVLMASGDVAEIASRIVQTTGEANLDIIPAGPRRPNAPELLSGQNFAELLAWADANYDQVLVDCPPVLAVSDAQIVGRLVDGVLVVISPEKNHRRLVTRACDSFRSAGVHVFGVVANRISTDAGKGYGYGYGYAYNYGEDTEGGDSGAARNDALIKSSSLVLAQPDGRESTASRTAA